MFYVLNGCRKYILYINFYNLKINVTKNFFQWMIMWHFLLDKLKRQMWHLGQNEYETNFSGLIKIEREDNFFLNRERNLLLNGWFMYFLLPPSHWRWSTFPFLDCTNQDDSLLKLDTLFIFFFSSLLLYSLHLTQNKTT